MQGGRIFLLGFMGCGKTFLGMRLAQMLNRPFKDLDDIIIERNQASIPQIFEQYGEGFFRREERASLHTTVLDEEIIISLGGGTPCFFDNMDWINRHGLSIFLDPSIEILVARLRAGQDKRPLLKGLEAADLKDFIEKKLAGRRPYYEQAELHFKPTGETEEDIKALIELIYTKEASRS